MKRKPLSLLALLLSASLAFSGCELDTSTSSASSTSTKSETSIATTVSETEGSTAPFETSSVIEETTTSSTETTTPVSTTTTTVSTTAEPVVEITEFSDDSPMALSNKNRQKKNRKGSMTFTVMGNINSVVWRLYFYIQGRKCRCIGRNFFNWFPAVL